MKKALIIPIIATLVFLLFTPKTHSQVSFLPTKLKITVIDGTGNFVENSTVTLYLSKDDYINSENPLTSKLTDEKGRVKFKDMEPRIYFLDVRKGDKSNDGRGSQTDKLNEGKTNKVNVVIE